MARVIGLGLELGLGLGLGFSASHRGDRSAYSHFARCLLLGRLSEPSSSFSVDDDLDLDERIAGGMSGGTTSLT
jgi:hypothetical protein